MHFSLFDHALAQEPPFGGHEIHNYKRPFLIYHNHTLSFSDLCLEVEKIFKEIMQFQYLTNMTTPWPGGHEIYNSWLSLFPIED